MRTLVQNCITHEFVGRDDRWRLDPDAAMAFGSTTDALDYCMNKQVKDAQIVLRFEHEALDVKVPVGNRCKEKGC